MCGDREGNIQYEETIPKGFLDNTVHHMRGRRGQLSILWEKQ
jgi:hypothetical protein